MKESGWMLRRFQERGYKSTKNRQRILRVIEEQEGVFCAADILAKVGNNQKVTVYRVIDFLVEFDCIHPVIQLDGHQYFELHPVDSHHHHAVCEKCHTTTCVDCDYVERSIPGFNYVHHNVVLTGLCQVCS